MSLRPKFMCCSRNRH